VLNIFTRLFGSRNQRLLRRYAERVRQANGFAEALAAETDEGLRARTDKLRARLVAGETLDDILPEAFATAREAASRAVSMRPFDVQLIGGMVLHDGKISEMRTGEGKTLVATLPVYLNALAGKGVHVVTVNEYLAARDAEWMGPVYRLLGLSVGVIASGQSPADKRAAYACDVTYGTNNEFGFDYLRDNLAARLEDRVQRGQHFAIVDEVDSILIDEARTPLIISGPAEESTELYVKINALVPRFRRQETEEGEGDYYADEKSRQVHLSESGFEKAEELMQEAGLLREGESLYDPASIRLMHHLNAALRAHVLYQKDVEYIVRGGEVIIVDEFTGRTMIGRRWSDGPAPGRRGEGGRPHPRGKPDDRFDHVPELLPPVPEARRHDRHGRHRGLRVPADLRARGRRGADPQADGPQGHAGPRLPEPDRQVRRDHRGHPGLRETRPAGAGRHDLDRDLGKALEPPQAGGRRSPGAEREAARARGDDRRPGRPARKRHDRDQHGRDAEPTSCSAATSRARWTSSARTG
jgi:hypothetical protein